MNQYVVNSRAQFGGEHEVHQRGCAHFPSRYIQLGHHESCHTAVERARQYFGNVDGCFFCCHPCHKQ